ncbi:AB hydrolase superfamily protein [Pleurotus pulmonarius]
MTSYNIHQQVFSLNTASNMTRCCHDTQGALQSKMDQALQPALDKLKIGPWKVVWGPTVWKLKPEDNTASYDHSWFVAHNGVADWGNRNLCDTYVVSIAGTADHSLLDAIEDVCVKDVVDFAAFTSLGASSPPVPTAHEAIDPRKAYIASGTADGVYRILNIASAGQGTTLAEFLGNISATASTRIVFTGHSLGGALSPTVALTALKSGMLSSVPQGNTFAYPTAGPSPGNGPFASLFAESLPLIKSDSGTTDDPNAAAYQVWNANIWNEYDIVPHAWNTGSLSGQNLWDILTIYGELPPALLREVAAVIARVTCFLQPPPGIDYVPIQGSRLLPATPPTPQSWRELLHDVASPQHGEPYKNIVGVPTAPLLCQCGSSPSEVSPILKVIDDARKKLEENRGN